MVYLICFSIIGLVWLSVIAFEKFLVKRNADQLLCIEEFKFPSAIAEKVKEKYNHLSDFDLAKVEVGLREWFYVCHTARIEPVSMPSQVVDVAWHEFILYTKSYQLFCKKAFGRFLHHEPAEAMESTKSAQKGIKVTWRIACTRGNMEPKSPNKMPILFELDSKLNIPDGFKYSLNCSKRKDGSYCASHIGCSAARSFSLIGNDTSSSCGGSCGRGLAASTSIAIQHV